MTLGERICARRSALGLSQDKLAEQLDVSRQSVSKWETDASVPELDKLVRLSEVFGMTLDELVRGEGGEPPQREEMSVQTASACEQPPAASRDGGRPGQILGAVFLAFGLLCIILLMGSGWGGWSLLVGGLFVILGVIALLHGKARLVFLWILWLLVVLLLVPAMTGVNPRWIFSNILYQLAAQGQYPWKYYLLLSWAEVLTGLALVLATVRLIRKRGKK